MSPRSTKRREVLRSAAPGGGAAPGGRPDRREGGTRAAPGAAQRQAPRGGLLDAALVAIVLAALWVRTPTGPVLTWLAHREGPFPSPVAWFDAEVPAALQMLVDSGSATIVVPDGGATFPEPWRSAALLEGPPELGAALDEAWRGGLDPALRGRVEPSLEAVAVGVEVRRRAVDRARAAGVGDSEAYLAHRAWLPASAQASADRAVLRPQQLATALRLRWPVDGAPRVSSPFGWRTHPTLGTKRFHEGVDLAVPVGTPVLAAQDGTVARSGEDPVCGRHVVLDHGHGVRTAYCHLDAAEVQPGEVVTRGQRVGASGNTGRSTGPHLHFTLRIGGKAVDPAPLRGVERS